MFMQKLRWGSGWVFFAIFGMFLASWLLWVKLTPAKPYTARALLKLDADPPKIIFVTSEKRADVWASVPTMIRSRKVLNAALRDPEMTRLKVGSHEPDPISWLADKIHVAFPNPECLEIRASGDDPEVVATIVNSVAGAYIQEVGNVEQHDRQKHYYMLRKLYDGYQVQLEQTRARIKKLTVAIGTGVDNERIRRVAEDLADCRTKQFEIALQKASLKARIAARKSDGSKADTATLEEELAGFEAQDKVILAEVARLDEEIRAAQDANARTLDLASDRMEIALKEQAARTIGQEVEALGVELNAPSRVRLMEKAVAPKTRGPQLVSTP
jgi:polysaccharide biosynthesis transport protein